MLAWLALLLGIQLLAAEQSPVAETGTLIEIVSSEAKSWWSQQTPDKAHDGNYDTYYSVQDDDTDRNFLKLSLSGINIIGQVKITNRLDGCCAQRIVDTEVKVYKGDIETGNCGTITAPDYEKNEDKAEDQAAQTYTLNCNGAKGDMIYITDLSSGTLGHGISEVKVYTLYVWIGVQAILGEMIHIDLETIPLAIKTDVTIDSDKMIDVRFHGDDDGVIGSIVIAIKSSLTCTYKLGHCMLNFADFPEPVELTGSGDDIWVISKQELSISVILNGEVILQKMLSGSLCDNNSLAKDWNWYWVKKILKVRFANIGG